MNNPFDDMSTPKNNPYETPQFDSQLELSGPTKEEQSWAIGIHLSGLVASLLGASVLGFLGPLILWLMKRHESGYLDDQGKEAVNFHLTMDLWGLAAGAITIISCGALFPVLIVPMVLQIVFSIIAAMKVNDGQRYRYPVTIRFF